MDAAQCVYFDASNPAYPAYNSETDYIKLQGGKFSSDVSAYVAKGYVQNENGTVEQLGETNAVAKVGDTYYKTLAEAVAAAKDGDTVTLLKNVVLNSTLTLNKNMTLDLNGCEISNGSTMGTNYLVSIAANANVSIVGDKANSKISDSRSNAQGTITAVVVYGKLTVEGDNLTISRGANGIAVKVEDNPGTLTVNGGTITVDKPTQTSSQAIQNWGNATISGGVFNGDVDSYAYIAANKNYVGNMTIENGTFDGEVFAAQYTNDGVTWPTKSAKVSIVGGNFKGNIAEYYHNGNNGPQPVEKVNKPDNAAESEVTVSDGYFTVDPSAYCVTGKTGVTSDKDGYQYKVGTIEVKDENEIKTDTQKGTTQATLSGEIAADKRPAAQAVGKSVTPTALTDTTPITADDKAQVLTELVKNKKVKLTDDGKIPAGTTVTVVKETYLDVTVTAYDATSNTVSMDIVPKYNLIAVAKTGTDEKTVTLKSAQDAKVGSTEVKVTLPDAFKGKKVYINHNNGANLYVATANATTGEITFTTNGFSPFTFALSNPNVVAEVNGNAYTSFQDAVNAVANGGTIEIVGGNKNYTATISGSSKTFTVKNTLDSDITVKVNNDSKTVGKNNGTQSFTYTKPSSGGSSGSSSGKTTYKVTTSAVNNGGVNASPSNAEKGAVITITLSPDKGYKLDKLTVTDGSGKTVSTVKKSDTVYTFTMPASAVKVGVSYVKATETPSETKFNDVSANDWFASAVDYVTGKGMMNGTADNTFSPKANTTRGMVVTVLYRLENQPSTSAASFTDVASGAYYANAVAWANANGIVSGYGSGKFGPNDKVTREQLAAILYRYAQYKKYDVSVGEDTNILSYDDAQSISSYAIPAIQWACGAGVVTGKSGSKLDPKGNATRAEVAAMLMRFCENVK
ncbi:S-layer homology domain-containing protein [Agathobaculum sp.]|uniref:S-layer homology domain-containing protein n=1 Tax=Agathobaculum sp. TaxID=2048138 RepID=UPI003AF1D5CF